MNIDTFIKFNQHRTSFWANANGWASAETNMELNKFNFENLQSLTECLKFFVEKEALTPGDLILAWANLGSVVEGNIALFLTIYWDDYQKSVSDLAPDRANPRGLAKMLLSASGNLKEPNKLNFEPLRQFIDEINLFEQHHSNIRTIQKYRNYIHSVDKPTLENSEEFRQHLGYAKRFIWELDEQCPYPEEFYSPTCRHPWN